MMVLSAFAMTLCGWPTVTVFFHLLPEGNNRVQLCRAFRLDLEDDFGLLLQIAKHDTIGAITIQEIEGNE